VRSYLYQNFSYPGFLDYTSRNDVLSGIAAVSGVELGYRHAGSDAAACLGRP
jgi:hypothetical protein